MTFVKTIQTYQHIKNVATNNAKTNRHTNRSDKTKKTSNTADLMILFSPMNTVCQPMIYLTMHNMKDLSLSSWFWKVLDIWSWLFCAKKITHVFLWFNYNESLFNLCGNTHDLILHTETSYFPTNSQAMVSAPFIE